MDDLDGRILALLKKNARMPVKEIARQVDLSSPAVSSRIHRLEEEGVIGGYTVVLHHPHTAGQVQALVSVLIGAAGREEFLRLTETEEQIRQCWRVTGSCNFIVKVSCPGIDALEHLLTRIQRLGSTTTQIILTTQVDRSPTPDD